MLHLFIKGNVLAAHEACKRAGIPFHTCEPYKPRVLSHLESAPMAHATVGDEHRRAVTAWYNREPDRPPYPAGTLLLFTASE